jgi:hypothetical protein
MVGLTDDLGFFELFHVFIFFIEEEDITMSVSPGFKISDLD